MKVLVTGGAGFIGSHLVHRLCEQGTEVVVIDDLSSGEGERLPSEVRLVRQDITSADTVTAIAELRPTHIVHAAAQVSVHRSMEDPAADRAVNLIGTAHVIEGARRAKAQRLVFISSGGAIYGDTTGADESTTSAPESYYGIHKLAAEGYVRLSGMSHAVARLSNAFGAGQRADLEGGVIAIFCRAASQGAPITVHGDGEQVRDFVHVDDVVGALEAMLLSSDSGTWNVASGVATTINQLVTAVEAAYGVTLDVARTARRPGDVRSSVLRVDAIRRDLGWEPSVSLSAGLAKLAGRSHHSDPR